MRRRAAGECARGFVGVALDGDRAHTDFAGEGDGFRGLGVVADEGLVEDEGDGLGDLVRVSDEGERRAGFVTGEPPGSLLFLSRRNEYKHKRAQTGY